VIHGDVRAENVLVGKDGKSVWLVDFEFSSILSIVESADYRRYTVSLEKEEVSKLLSKFKAVCEATRTHANGSGAIP
jgi:tRNA A-37 threonylcarbamoyl transferase component Bud32